MEAISYDGEPVVLLAVPSVTSYYCLWLSLRNVAIMVRIGFQKPGMFGALGG
jgi:hypothetical protein